MKTYKFLVLTDHRGHSKENSIYAILGKLSQHPQCEKIHIADRANPENDPFFDEKATDYLSVSKVTEKFKFKTSGKQFAPIERRVRLSDYDVIFMRLPRPVTSSFLQWLAEVAADKIIINHPLGIEKTSNKAYLLNFPEICPPIRLCRSLEEIMAFAEQFPIVLKPLKEFGGKGLLKLEGGYLTTGSESHDPVLFLEQQRAYIESEGYLAMKFLHNVSQGDNRILVVGGEILASSLRLPAPGSWLCNVAQGGTAVPSQITPEEEVIIRTVSPPLLSEGILIFGVDTLVNDAGKRVLSEINTLSIGGFPQAEQQTGKPVLQQTIDKIISYVNDQSG